MNRFLPLLLGLALCGPALGQVPGGGGVVVGDPITGSCPNGQVVYSNNQKVGCKAVAGTGTVTSVDGSSSGGTLTATGGPVVATGTLNFEINLAHANIWTAAQTYANSMFLMLGSSTGFTTFTSDNAGASNFTMHIPAANDTLATLAAAQTLTNKTINGASNTLTVRLGSDISGFGAGVATALGVNVGSAGAPVLFNGALGTPSSGVATNLTSIPVAQATGVLPAANGGAGTISGALKGNGSGTVSQAACADLSNGGSACLAATGTSGHTVPYVDGTNVWSGQQSGSPTTLSISTATFTPTGATNNYVITLVHASCPCTLANPSATPVAGTAGQIIVNQSATGSDTIGTWGSSYTAPGGTSTITLSTGANARDVLSYYVVDSTHILLLPALNFSH